MMYNKFDSRCSQNMLDLVLDRPPPPGYFTSVPKGREGVQGWPHIQVDGCRIVLLRLTAVIVYNIPHLPPTSVHHPVVAIKGELIAAGEGGYEAERGTYKDQQTMYKQQ